MMSDLLFKLWERGKKMEANAPALDFEHMARKGINKFHVTLGFYLWFYLAVQGVILGLTMINLGIYRANPVMLPVQIGIGILSLCIIGYGVFLLREMHQIGRMELDTASLIRRRLTFIRVRYEIWFFMIAATLIMLIMAINTYTDHVNGTYRINHPFIFVGVTTAVFVFAYVINKIGLYPVVREMKAFLSDLEAQVRDETQKVEGLKRRWRIYAIIGIVAGLVFLILGILRSMHYLR